MTAGGLRESNRGLGWQGEQLSADYYLVTALADTSTLLCGPAHPHGVTLPHSSRDDGLHELQ